MGQDTVTDRPQVGDSWRQIFWNRKSKGIEIPPEVRLHLSLFTVQLGHGFLEVGTRRQEEFLDQDLGYGAREVRVRVALSRSAGCWLRTFPIVLYFLVCLIVWSFEDRIFAVQVRRSCPRWLRRTSGSKGLATPPRAAAGKSTRTSSSLKRPGAFSYPILITMRTCSDETKKASLTGIISYSLRLMSVTGINCVDGTSSRNLGLTRVSECKRK